MNVGMRFGLVASVAFGGLQPPSAKGCEHQAGGLRSPWASPAPMLRRRPSSGTGARLRAQVVILGFAEYGLFSVYKSSVFLLLYR